MNQILMVEDKKKSTVEIANIVKFFAFITIVFSIFIIGHSSYAMYKSTLGRNTENLPVVHMSRKNDNAVVKVNSTNDMVNLKYSWNNSEETIIPAEGKKYIREEIMLPIENSTLRVTVEEKNGRAVQYNKQFIIEGLDTTKPVVDIDETEKNNSQIKITATDETEIEYMTYKINDSDEIRIDRSEAEDKKTINYVLKLDIGENRITVTAVDKSGNVEVYEKTIIVSYKTGINLRVENDELLVEVTDVDGIKDIEVNLNGLIYKATNVNKRGTRSRLKLVEGNNTVRVQVTNINESVTAGAREFKYEP